VLVTTPAIANLIREGKTYQIRSALQAGRGAGMHTMDQHLADLVNSGTVPYGAALEKVHDHEDFKRLVHRTGDTDPAGATFASEFGAQL
jgi:twitching motility protein PilT